MTTQERRAAADLRRQAAERIGERDGETAYEAYRRKTHGVGQARRVPMKTQLTAESVERGGKDLVHTSGFFTRYGISYPMWDQFGEYEESVRPGAGQRTISSRPDVAFLINHAGMTMARTTNGTLILEERAEGGWHDAYLNPQRSDVHDLVIALQDGSIDQMSFAFMIPDGKGMWSADFMHFEILEYDLDRGDVSAVNYGASPYTDISARTAEVLNDLEHLPMGALRAAESRLILRGLDRAPRDTPAAARERIEVREHVEPVVIAQGTSSKARDRLAHVVASTAGRYLDRAPSHLRREMGDLIATRLDWFEIRNATGADPEDPAEPDTATVYVYDEIGSSFGVEASSFAQALDEITTSKISVRINSPGGSVFDAIAIHSSLLHHPARVRTYIDGLAASAASVIAMAADPYDESADSGGVIMMPGGELMIHDASMTDSGTAAEKESARAYLDRQSQNIATMYAGRAGGDPQEWRDLMIAETWMFGNEAVDLGLADKVYERTPAAPSGDMAERMARRHNVAGRYRFNRRAAAGDPMQTRAEIRARRERLLDKQISAVISKRASEVLDPLVLGTSTEQAANRSNDRQNRPVGRSIALIEAQLAVDE